MRKDTTHLTLSDGPSLGIEVDVGKVHQYAGRFNA